MRLDKGDNDARLENMRSDLWVDLEEVLVQEEIMWLQRSRCNWYKDGDKNTRYFHSMANSRKKINNIEALKDEEGECDFDQEKIRQMGTCFFQSLYKEDEEGLKSVNFGRIFPSLTDEDLIAVGRSITIGKLSKLFLQWGHLRLQDLMDLTLSFSRVRRIL